MFGSVRCSSPFGPNQDDRSQGSRFSRGAQSNHSSQKGELDIQFWELFPDEHLWNRVKALNLYEKANCLVLLYNCDDSRSFQTLIPVLQDFCTYNQNSAYILLVGVVGKKLWDMKSVRKIKRSQIQAFMDEMGIPSFAEVFIEGPKPINMDLVNRHMKLIMASFIESIKSGVDKA